MKRVDRKMVIFTALTKREKQIVKQWGEAWDIMCEGGALGGIVDPVFIVPWGASIEHDAGRWVSRNQTRPVWPWHRDERVKLP